MPRRKTLTTKRAYIIELVEAEQDRRKDNTPSITFEDMLLEYATLLKAQRQAEKRGGG